ncbi:MAG: DUF1178 family protein [Pseudomonadota bacterium]
MILYRLICAEGHEFESWFASSSSFEEQQAAGLISCACCGSTEIERSLMAPAVRPGGKSAALTEPADQKAAMLAKLRRKIEAESDYVGPEFAEEARRINLGEAEARGIWGEASGEEAKSLIEDGIPIAPLPFMRRLDS